MSIIRGQAIGVFELAADLTATGPKAVPALRSTMAAAGVAFANQWAENVKQTGGTHLPHLPRAIDSELTFDLSGVSVDVGPNTAKKQGKLGRGDEFGSVNQPAHLNGLRAMDVAARATEASVAESIRRILP